MCIGHPASRCPPSGQWAVAHFTKGEKTFPGIFGPAEACVNCDTLSFFLIDRGLGRVKAKV